MAELMTCPNPNDGQDRDLTAHVRNLVICPGCLRTIAWDVDAHGLPIVRLAVADDTTSLTDAEIGQLKQARKTARTALVS